MNSYASALARGGLSDAEQREYAATIAAASESLSTMVSNILRLNKLENQEITPNAAPYDLTRQLCDCALDARGALGSRRTLISTPSSRSASWCWPTRR